MQPSIVIFGKNGQVGYELNQRLSSLYKVIALTSKEADFSKPDAVAKILEQLKPDIIINAAAHTAVDKAETERDLAYLVNSETPAIIANYCKQHHSLLIHYSTDFVFDGQNDKAYLETDNTNPLGVYGASKLQGEEKIQQSGCQHLIFRTSWVYGLRGHNFLLTMLRLAHEREQMKVVNDQLGSPVWCGHIAATTVKVLEHILLASNSSHAPSKNSGNLDVLPSMQGVYNLTANGHTSWYGFASKILQLDPSKKSQKCNLLLPIPTSEYPTPAARPKWSVLDNSKTNFEPI